MSLKSIEYHNQMKFEKKKRNNMSKQVEQQLLIELKDKLKLLLDDCDRVMFEVNTKVLGEFLNILEQNVLSMYDYEQIDANQFIFSSKEISI